MRRLRPALLLVYMYDGTNMAKKRQALPNSIPEMILRRYARFREVTVDNCVDLGWLCDWDLIGLTNPKRARIALWALLDQHAAVLKFDGVWAAQLDDYTEYNNFSDAYLRGAADLSLREIVRAFKPRDRGARANMAAVLAGARDLKTSNAKCFEILGAVGVHGMIICDRVSLLLCSKRDLSKAVESVMRNPGPSGYPIRRASAGSK